MAIFRALRNRSGGRFVLGAFVTATLWLAGPSLAAPDGPVVTHGQATVRAGAGSTTIQQTTQQAIINWNGFSIDAGELVRFIQPSQLSAVLNRVTGVDASVINGVLQGNGQIFLINPNGVLIGPGGQVNAGGFLASTLNLSDSDFLSGNMQFTQDPNRDMAAIVNQGQIKVTDGGFVVLTAPSIANEGIIIARAGEVKLGAGTKSTVNFDGRNLISFALDTSAPTSQGTVVLSRADTSNVLAQVVRSSGVEEAGTLVNSGSIEAQSILFQAGAVDAPGFTRSADIVVDTPGDAALGSHFALDGHSILVTAGGDITFDALVAERANNIGGLVSLSADGLGGISVNPEGSGIAADTVNLSASRGSINTSVAANSVTANAPNGSITLSLRPGLIDGHGTAQIPETNNQVTTPIDPDAPAGPDVPLEPDVPVSPVVQGGTLVGTQGTRLKATAGGDISVDSVNTILVDQVSGRDVYLQSQTGSIVDAGDVVGADNRDIISTGSTTLSAQDFVGTLDNPLEIEVAGNLQVTARQEFDGISGVLNGRVDGNFAQTPETAGTVLLNFGIDGNNGLKQALSGVVNGNGLPGDDVLGGGSLPSLFFVTLYNSIDDELWLDLLRGAVVWEDEADEAGEGDL